MKTALVVDDTKNIRILLSKCLENENYIVYSAINATEALDLVSKHTFDIAFIDIKMPNISGTVLLESLRSQGYMFPVIIMTAFGTIKNAVTTTQMGAKSYLQKPFTANTIRKTLLEIFPDDTHSPEIQPKYIIKKNLSLPNYKTLLSTDPTDPRIYEEISTLLINNGEIEKGELFKDFSNKLRLLKLK